MPGCCSRPALQAGASETEEPEAIRGRAVVSERLQDESREDDPAGVCNQACGALRAPLKPY
jgi:hypothetical protein